MMKFLSVLCLIACAGNACAEPEDPINWLLPDLGDLPPPVIDDAAWDEVDAIQADATLLERKKHTLPPASALLPPIAIALEPRTYPAITITGNKRFSKAELLAVTAFSPEQAYDPAGLAAMADAVTRHYVSHGHINSGAVFEEADDGPLRIIVTEGVIHEVAVIHRDAGGAIRPADDCFFCLASTQRRLRDRYLRARVAGKPGGILDFEQLQARIQTLQMNPNIKRIQAELRPGPHPGEARVELAVEETHPWAYGLDVHNQLDLRIGVFEGGTQDTKARALDQWSARYSIPIRWDDTTLEFFGSRQAYAILEEPFDELDINGSSWTAGSGLRRPWFQRPDESLWLGASLSRIHSETELMGMPFSISQGYVDGEVDLTPLSFRADWLKRGANQVTAASIESVHGLDALGATSSKLEADSSFFILRANAQYLTKVGSDGHLLSIRAAGQWADDALPSPVQWTMGGNASVRGYRENDVVRDIGLTTGIEYRIPLLDKETGSLQGILFSDAGVAADHEGDDSTTLWSAGAGVSWTYKSWLRGDLFVGVPILERDRKGSDLQDYGVHFRIGAGRFW
jgi:hemolysin activation/secretion protein